MPMRDRIGTGEHRHAGEGRDRLLARIALEDDDTGRRVPEPLLLPNGSRARREARRREEVGGARRTE